MSFFEDAVAELDVSGTHTITNPHGHSTSFRNPERLPRVGDVYVFTKPMGSAANVWYKEGDKLTLLEHGVESPHGWKNSNGNWRVRCKAHSSSVWSGIDSMIAVGDIALESYLSS